MSDAGYEKVNESLGDMIPKAHEMGIPTGFDPFITFVLYGSSCDSGKLV